MSSSPNTLEGPLSKWTNVMKGWQFRWFVLEEKVGVLSYFTSKEKMSKGVRRGCVRLKGAVVGIDDQDMTTFTITVDHKTFHFQAQDSEERELWVRRLEDTILRHAARLRGQNWDVGSIYNNFSCTKRGNILELFDKKVTEADAYLQLLIEQVNVIDAKIEALEKTEDKEKCEEIKTQANAMLENVKHAIVLLQIAKNTVHPINGVYKKSIRTQDSQPEFAMMGQGVAFGAECKENKNVDGESETDAISVGDPSIIDVPFTSYSSSEGEDDFEDANDEFFSAQANSPMSRQHIVGELDDDDDDPVVSIKSEHTQSEGGQRKGGTLPMNRDGSVDYDAMYEDDSDSDTMSMESHGSVVTHLLSQVKIGMDLTKVVLPTFILERRSLLEMYADYFAHPDVFVQIAAMPTPRERMVQTVKWYLSSYHAGRKSSVAKKPYNPILGEIFQCHWNVPADVQDNEAAELVAEGPVPWCKSNQLTFVAEQVSHHPPISAFYAENVNRNISFNAYVWTKSKFLGISIGVHNVGQGVVTLNDLNEEYIVTFPNGYGRSILTVPWIELGGPVTITCPQTNYRAEIEFLTKPFYGGKRNRISAEIFAPNEKKSFMSIAGEWSGAMQYKLADNAGACGPWRAKQGDFVNVNELPVSKKKVRPIAEQAEFESRRIWKEVTAGLKLNDIERATSAKSVVEQKQRDEAKVRKETSTAWRTRSFYSIGDAWNYKNPLSKRIYENK